MLENRFPSSPARHPAWRLGCGARGLQRRGLEENGPPAPRAALRAPSVFYRTATCRPTPRAARADTGYSAEHGRSFGCTDPASAPQDSRAREQHPQGRPCHLPAPRRLLRFPVPTKGVCKS